MKANRFPNPIGLILWWGSSRSEPRDGLNPVYQRDIYISETNLYDLAKNQLVWSGIVRTVDPSDIKKEIKRFADSVIEALRRKNFLPST